MSATDDTIEYLVQANASVNLQDKSGASALMYAVRRRKMDAILALCKHGADILLPSHVRSVRYAFETGVECMCCREHVRGRC
eukprot:m.159320 g.159320  ORF g.159320 m.159320 type:complete len:82 (+) comp14527_c0_seq4:1202-1447(+)